MAWIVLIASGILESVWATALGRSDGLRHPIPTIVFIAALTASMAGLAYSMRWLPTGTAYAVWVGIGALLTVGVAMVTGEENASVARILCVGAIIGGVIGLKIVS